MRTQLQLQAVSSQDLVGLHKRRIRVVVPQVKDRPIRIGQRGTGIVLGALRGASSGPPFVPRLACADTACFSGATAAELGDSAGVPPGLLPMLAV